MAATVIGRDTWTDDDGTGTSGTILNNAVLQAHVYDRIDALLAGGAAHPSAVFGKGVGWVGVATGSAPAGAASEARVYYDSTLDRFLLSLNNSAFEALRTLGEQKLLNEVFG
jgi:hypothetical protein